jgi:ankyrin repeat protein
MYEIPMSPLDNAIKHGHIYAVKLLLEHGATRIYDHVSILDDMIARGNITMIDLILTYGIYDDYKITLSSAINSIKRSHKNRYEIVELLLKHGADPDYRGLMYHTPLRIECYYGDIKMVKLLLTYGANPLSKCSSGITPLDTAIQGNHHDIVEMLRTHSSNLLI